jgi:iron complex outermembrane receptor protein
VGVQTAALSQTPTGRLSGIVTDPSGAAVPGAQVRIKNLDSGLAKSIVTDREGRYALGGVPAGHYQVSADYSGFEAAVRDGVAVSEGSESTVALALSLGKSAAIVQVTDRAPIVGPESIAPARIRTSDAASLLGGIPGLDIYGSGGVSGIPAIHGMADERVNVLVNGMSLASACANHMNPPTSYIDPSNVGSVSVMAGLTPVSQGGDSIAGTILMNSPAPEFAQPGQGVLFHGGISEFHRTNGVVNGGNAWVSAATGSLRVGYIGSYVNANDYKDGAGMMVKSTFYESQNHTIQLAARHGNHLVTFDLGYQHIPQQGFVNARMDMTDNEARSANVHYTGAFARVRLDARLYFENTRHVMNILRDKVPGMNMPMDTNGTNLGYSVAAEIPLSGRDTLRLGSEFRHFSLSDWWTPVTATVGSMGPNTLLNVNAGRRDRFGTFVEWEATRGRGWTELFGVRSDVVRMNTGNVAGYNMSTTTTGSGAYYADAAAFNARDRHRLDNNFDLTGLARYEPNSTATFEFGYARKTRSPSIYERYLWVKRSSMSANMNGWFGDGNGYTGNLDLRPEIANTVSATLGTEVHSLLHPRTGLYRRGSVPGDRGWEQRLHRGQIRRHVRVRHLAVCQPRSQALWRRQFVQGALGRRQTGWFCVDRRFGLRTRQESGHGEQPVSPDARSRECRPGASPRQLVQRIGVPGRRRQARCRSRPQRVGHSGLRARQSAHRLSMEGGRTGGSASRCRPRQPH